MDTITASSTKAEIVSAACELADHQATTITRLREEQRLLWAVLAALAAWALL